MEKHLFELEELFDRLQCAGQPMETSLKIAMILRSVPDSYAGLVTALESRKDEDLSIDLVKQKLVDEWQRRAERENHGEPEERAMKLYTKRQEEKVCYYCYYILVATLLSSGSCLFLAPRIAKRKIVYF